MNKKVIWIIIGLMAAAMIGVAWLQVNWIRFSINLNEEQFDNNAMAALNKVAERFEYEEQLEFYNFMSNGYVRSYMEKEMRQRLQDGDLNVSISFENSEPAGDLALSKQDLINIILTENDCNCAECKDERVKRYGRVMQFNQGLDYTDMVDRLPDLDLIEKYIRQEFENHGINIEHEYGVYSKRKKSMVIANGHYTVEDDNPQVMMEGYNNLYNSKYSVNLFQNQNGQTPGLLMVYFPSRSSYLWASVWRSLLAAIIFTAIILFCFAYTVQVIFFQKKVGEMKTDFINNMTHEFKTPIATISLAADSITSPMISGKPDKVQRFADIIKQENKRMNSQVEKVLQMALIDKRDFELKVSDVNVHEVIGQAVENITLQVEKRGGYCQTELNAELPVIQADLTHISNIMNNLLDNANKYSPEKPEISVLTRNVPNGVEVIISDKGVGMTKEARKHIFDKFYRVHTGNLHDVKGFGLGLSYVKAMMTAHKGQIDVKSELGKGSTFILFFPFRVES
ncbi:MAG: HAMP domain-containing histidine kinase [Bacteroidetes bacterium]|nr:HAMP domain-containing histidine kinase [Bacteroidota bacterium]